MHIEIAVLTIILRPTKAVSTFRGMVAKKYKGQISTPLSVSKRKAADICLDSLKAFIRMFRVWKDSIDPIRRMIPKKMEIII